MKSIVYNVRISIIDKYTEESFENENLKKIMKDIETNLYLDKCKKEAFLLASSHFFTMFATFRGNFFTFFSPFIFLLPFFVFLSGCISIYEPELTCSIKFLFRSSLDPDPA